MYRFALLPCLLVSSALHAGIHPSAETDDVAQILKVERDVCAAYEREDADWLQLHLDPRFTLTSSTGQVSTREQEVDELQDGRVTYDVFRNHDSRVRLYGDAAVVTGVTEVAGHSDGKPFSGSFQFTDTYVRTPSGWVIVASHASRLPERK